MWLQHVTMRVHGPEATGGEYHDVLCVLCMNLYRESIFAAVVLRVLHIFGWNNGATTVQFPRKL